MRESIDKAEKSVAIKCSWNIAFDQHTIRDRCTWWWKRLEGIDWLRLWGQLWGIAMLLRTLWCFQWPRLVRWINNDVSSLSSSFVCRRWSADIGGEYKVEDGRGFLARSWTTRSWWRLVDSGIALELRVTIGDWRMREENRSQGHSSSFKGRLYEANRKNDV